MVDVRRLSREEMEKALDGLAEVLVDCVEDGASVGFLSPFLPNEAKSFFAALLEGVEKEERILLAAFVEGRVVGTVQVIKARYPNQPHRADIAKLLVHRCARGQGVGAALMQAAEREARAAGRTLLVLDTAGGAAERLYLRQGWQRVGAIPNYALWPDGRPCDTTIFWKQVNDTCFGDLRLRLATMEDAGAIATLIEESVRTLQAPDYTPEQREGALGTVFGVDRQLIADGTYLVMEADGELAGCGGWSRRKTLFGGDDVAGKDDSLLDPAVDAARIRAFFVRPGFERRGIGSAILRACEAAAGGYGFTRFELVATLTGVPFYARHGFVAVERFEVGLAGGTMLPVVKMRKERA